MNLKLAGLNLCLGLSKKKDDVANIVRENKINILCMQEIELEPGTNPSMFSIKNYSLRSRNKLSYKKSWCICHEWHRINNKK